MSGRISETRISYILLQRRSRKYRDSSLSLHPVVTIMKKELTKFFAKTSVTHGDNVPAISKGDELPLSEELSSSWEPEKAAIANLVCYIFDGFITCQLVMCNSLAYL